MVIAADEIKMCHSVEVIRRRICDYADETGKNLMERCFERLTSFQASKFKIQVKAVFPSRGGVFFWLETAFFSSFQGRVFLPVFRYFCNRHGGVTGYKRFA